MDHEGRLVQQADGAAVDHVSLVVDQNEIASSNEREVFSKGVDLMMCGLGQFAWWGLARSLCIVTHPERSRVNRVLRGHGKVS